MTRRVQLMPVDAIVFPGIAVAHRHSQDHNTVRMQNSLHFLQDELRLGHVLECVVQHDDVKFVVKFKELFLNQSHPIRFHTFRKKWICAGEIMKSEAFETPQKAPRTATDIQDARLPVQLEPDD